MKNFFSLLFVICFLFIGTSSAQWWVRGGNLLWPYGNVEIAKDLTVSGEVTLDSNVTINGDLDVSGTVGGVKQYIAMITWNEITDPSVAEIINTTGDIFTWDNVANTGDNITITSTTNLFTANKVSMMTALLNSGGQNYFIIGKRTSDTVYTLSAWNDTGDSQVIPPGLPLLVKIEIYP